MTVKEFAAFTSLSPSKIRAEIRAGNLQANKIETVKVDGVTTQAHYEITEDPAAWLKRRNPQQENQQQQTTAQDQDSQEESPLPPRQKSLQEQAGQGTGIWAVLGWAALGLMVTGALGILYAESRRNY